MKIRKLESITTHYSSEVANLDPEMFRNLSKPYKGNSNEEFLNYLWDNIFYMEDMLSEMTDELADEVYKLIEPPQIEIWNSTTKGSSEWMESGEINTESQKNGGFITEYTTEN